MFWYAQKPTLLAHALTPLAYLYGAVAAAHGAWRARNPYYAGVPVISIGNLTVGGTGKTPVTAWLAQHFASAEGGSHQVAIVSRGYKGTENATPTQVNPSGHTAAQVGDEPLMLARQLQRLGVTVWIGADRPHATQRAEQAGASLILLDDGFQRRDVYRNVDIVVVDGTRMFGNNLPLPAGPLREFPSALARATFAIVLNDPNPKPTYLGVPAYRLNLESDVSGLQLPPAPAKSPKRTGKSPKRPTNDTSNPQKSPEITQNHLPSGTAVVAFAGVGNPSKFFKSLQKKGLTLAAAVPFADHHTYTPENMNHLKGLSKSHHAPLVTTAKDATKLPVDFAHIIPATLTGTDAESILADLQKSLK